MRISISKLVLLSGLILNCTGCDSRGQSDLDEMGREIKRAFGQIEQLAPDRQTITNRSTAEVQKLFVVEYRVLDIDPQASPAQVQAQLQALGSDRWDCFSVSTLDTAIRFYCKRRPISVLRYLAPGVF